MVLPEEGSMEPLALRACICREVAGTVDTPSLVLFCKLIWLLWLNTYREMVLTSGCGLHTIALPCQPVLQWPHMVLLMVALIVLCCNHSPRANTRILYLLYNYYDTSYSTIRLNSVLTTLGNNQYVIM